MKTFQNNRKSIDDLVACVIIFLLILGLLLIIVNLKQDFTWPILYGYLFFLGWFSWTFVEYMFHRFVWHSKRTNKANSQSDTFNHLYHHQHPDEIKMNILMRILLVTGSLIFVGISIWIHNYFTIATGFVCGFTTYNFTHWFLHQRYSQKIFPKKVSYYNMISPKVIDFYFGEKIKKPETSIKKELVILVMLFFTHLYSPAQQESFHYDVVRNGKVIGFVNVSEKTNGNVVLLELKSDVKTRFLTYGYNSDITENAVFENGVMTYSFYYKKENGKETFVEAKKSGGYFNIVDNGHTSLDYRIPVRYNFIQLFCDAPGMNTKVYSNKFQQFLDIKKVAANKYRLSLPDGNYNYYTYKNGICSQVDIERTFFTIHFVLRN